MQNDTIAAIATAMSPSGIGIIRISGDDALSVIDRIYKSKNNKKKISASDLNIRVPSGNEATANDLWIPGGYTSGGVPEAITDTIPLDRTHVTRIDIN